MKRAVTVAAAVLAAAALVAYAAHGGTPDPSSNTARESVQSQAKGGPQLRDVESVDQLRTLFNAQSETPRLIVLASPT